MLTRYERLEKALNQRGVSLRALWQQGVITRYTYYKCHDGKSLNVSEIHAIATVLDVSIDAVYALID